MIDEGKRAEMVQGLVKTAFEHYSADSRPVEDRERQLIRGFNHEQELSEEVLRGMFGDNYEKEVARLVLRN
jgi:hypothetical protein